MASSELGIRTTEQSVVVQEAPIIVVTPEQTGETQVAEASVAAAAIRHQLTPLDRLHDVEQEWASRGVELNPTYY
jgi:hypothetical protein